MIKTQPFYNFALGILKSHFKRYQFLQISIKESLFLGAKQVTGSALRDCGFIGTQTRHCAHSDHTAQQINC